MRIILSLFFCLPILGKAQGYVYVGSSNTFVRSGTNTDPSIILKNNTSQGASAHHLLQIRNSANDVNAWMRGDGAVGGTVLMTTDNVTAAIAQVPWGYVKSGMNLKNTAQILWSSGSSWWNEAKDLGISRNGAGVLEINNGTTGTLSDLILRNLFTTGNVGIGTTNTQGYKFAVNGDAIFTKVKVKTYATWPDYVFHFSYKLLPLRDLEDYIKQNNHLPDIPSSKEVEKNGLDLADNQAALLKKIEELTLYMIDLNKKLDKVVQENEELKKKMQSSN